MSKTCKTCKYFNGTDTCGRYPKYEAKTEEDRCGEFKVSTTEPEPVQP